LDEAILTWLRENRDIAWISIPALAFLEACPGLGLFVSGVILLSVSTLLYAEGILDLQQILPMAFAAAFVSDHMGFYLGRWSGTALHKSRFAEKRKKSIQRAEAFIKKYGALSIIGGRLLTAVRSLVPMLVGISGIRRLHFTLIDTIACLVWTTGLGLLIVGLDNLFAVG